MLPLHSVEQTGGCCCCRLRWRCSCLLPLATTPTSTPPSTTPSTAAACSGTPAQHSHQTGAQQQQQQQQQQQRHWAASTNAGACSSVQSYTVQPAYCKTAPSDSPQRGSGHCSQRSQQQQLQPVLQHAAATLMHAHLSTNAHSQSRLHASTHVAESAWLCSLLLLQGALASRLPWPLLVYHSIRQGSTQALVGCAALRQRRSSHCSQHCRAGLMHARTQKCMCVLSYDMQMHVCFIM
jgi:hypothetical protein